ncbi:S1C family serine protease [Mycolicibacterium sp. Dal123E01]|uniref:S1C family serine protease n=1 Tax=Mycolicibacterium sp. Dal123E01 TaxID=3457578 RepID=UPI00403E9EA8
MRSSAAQRQRIAGTTGLGLLQTAANLLGYTFLNRSPTISPGGQTTTADGNVTANLNAKSHNGFALTYDVKQTPDFGTVTIDQTTGQYVYTPGPALTMHQPFDSFSVTVDNGSSARLRGALGFAQKILHQLSQLFGLAQADSAEVTVTVKLGAPSVLAAAAQRTQSAVARIDTETGHGTGVVVSPGGQVLTAFHVVSERSDVTVVVAGRRYTASLAGYDRGHDVAVLQLLDSDALDSVTLASSPAQPGQWVTTLGNADGTDQPLSRGIGTIVAVDQSDTFDHPDGGYPITQTGLILTTIPRNPGDSGGPLVDASASLVGIVTSADFDDDTGAPKPRSFSVPAAIALTVINAVNQQTAAQGIHVGAQARFGAALGVAPAGTIVTEVSAGSAADIIGLQPGDTITSIDGEAIRSPLTVLTVLDNHSPGNVIDVEWTDASGRARHQKAQLG